MVTVTLFIRTWTFPKATMSESQYSISVLSSFGTELRSGFEANHTSAYETILNAEVEAVEIYKTLPHGEERDAAKGDVICARVVGGFLVETFAKRDRLGDVPASTIVRHITSTSGRSRPLFVGKSSV